MPKELLSFRCPLDLRDSVQELMDKSGINFSDLMIQALTLYIRQVKSQGGHIMPDYTQQEMEQCDEIYSKLMSEINSPAKAKGAGEKSPQA